MNRDKENMDNKNTGRTTGQRNEKEGFKQLIPALSRLKSNSPEVEMAPAGFSGGVNQTVSCPTVPTLI